MTREQYIGRVTSAVLVWIPDSHIRWRDRGRAIEFEVSRYYEDRVRRVSNMRTDAEILDSSSIAEYDIDYARRELR